MSSLRAGVYAVASSDSMLVAQLTDGASGLLGGPSSAKPPASGLWAILTFGGDVESLAPNAVDGLFQWWVYDDEQQGWERINAALGRLLALYVEQTGEVYRDSSTGEVIYWQGAGQLGPETEAPEYGQLVRWASWPYRKTHPGIYRAA